MIHKINFNKTYTYNIILKLFVFLCGLTHVNRDVFMSAA